MPTSSFPAQWNSAFLILPSTGSNAHASPEAWNESAPDWLTLVIPLSDKISEREKGGDHGRCAKVRAGAQAAGRRAVQEVRRRLCGGGARAGRRPRLAFQPGEAGGPEGGGRSQVAEPVPGGRGPAQAEKGERAAEARERGYFESRRPLRGQGSAKRAKFESVAVFGCRCPVSELCSAPSVTGRGCCARRKPAASERALRDAGLAAAGAYPESAWPG